MVVDPFVISMLSFVAFVSLGLTVLLVTRYLFNKSRGGDASSAPILAALGVGVTNIGLMYYLKVPEPNAAPKPKPKITPSSKPPTSTSSNPFTGISSDVKSLLLNGAIVVVCVLALAAIAFGLWYAVTAEKRRARVRAEAKAAFDASMKLWDAAATSIAGDINSWLEYDRDVSMLLRSPAIRDYSASTVQKFVSLMAESEKVGRRRPSSSTDREAVLVAVEKYEAMARDLSDALSSAVSYARGSALRRMAKADRSKLETAQRMLAIALDSAASPAERDTALARVRVLMDQLNIREPKGEVMEQLANQVRLMLTAPRMTKADVR